MKRIFSDIELKYINDNYQHKTYAEITDELNKFNEVKKTPKQVRTKAAVMGLSKTKHSYNRNFFNSIDNYIKSYWLGFVFADGYITHKVSKDKTTSSEVSIELKQSDEEHLIKFEQALGVKHPKIKHRITKDRYIKGVMTQGGTVMSYVRHYSADMYRDLVSHGVVQNKTYRSEYPSVDSRLFMPFLLGVIDGDGYIYHGKGIQIGIVNPNGHFLNYIKDTLSTEFDIKSYLYKEDDWKYRLVVCGDNAINLGNLMYDSCDIYLGRKKNVFDSFKHGLAI